MIKHWFSTDKKLSAALKNILGFYPGNIALYQMALRHKSVTRKGAANSETNNERLEFLGDAILDAVVAEHLFRLFPYKNEGFLTKMRSKAVSRHQLNTVAIKMGMEEMLNKEGFAGRETSIYGNALEALIGSVYLDKGFAAAKKFILKRFFDLYIDMDELEHKETDYKSKLIQWAQKGKVQLAFRVLNEESGVRGRNFSVGVFVDNTIMGQATSHSKKRAEQLAAEKAWEAIEVKNEA